MFEYVLDDCPMVDVSDETSMMHRAYCICLRFHEAGFRCVVVLPKGTNTDMEPLEIKNKEDELLFARNKWLIGHEEGGLPGNAFIGLKGENLHVGNEQ